MHLYSAVADELFKCVGHFVGLALKRLIYFWKEKITRLKDLD